MATTDYFVVCIRRKTVLFGETVALLPRVKDLASKGVFMQQICLDALILLRLLEYCKLAWYKHAEDRRWWIRTQKRRRRKKNGRHTVTVATRLRPSRHAMWEKGIFIKFLDRTKRKSLNIFWFIFVSVRLAHFACVQVVELAVWSRA